MTEKEKAKRYDAAIEELRGLLEGIHEEKCEILEEDLIDIFPELKESEDKKTERILHSISSKMSLHLRDTFTEEEFQYFDTWSNAWLEKQGEQEQLYIRFGEIPTDEKSKIFQGEIEVGTENGVSVYPAFKTSEGDIVLGLNLPITKTTLYTQQYLIEYDDRPCYLVSGDYVGKDTDGQPLINNVIIIGKIDTYRVKEKKQDEKKPIIEMITPEESLGIDSETYNKIVNDCIFGENKPKFKVGDWIKHNKANFIFQINKVTTKNYEFNNPDGYNHSLPIKSVDEKYHLWTIADAKEGDVLAEDPIEGHPSSFVAIYKKQNEEDFDTFDSYCFVGFDGKFYEGEYGHSSKDIHPATKEQRNLLFQKMKEEGYEWNAENKELKIIDWNKHIKYEPDGPSIIKENPAWGEEDEHRIKLLEALCEDKLCESVPNSTMYEEMKITIDWINSIKERIIE